MREQLRHDPVSGTIFIFRSKRADRLKILAWDGSGLILFWKRLEHGAFKWPPVSDDVMRLRLRPPSAGGLVSVSPRVAPSGRVST